jgi:FlaG/FlaF family flagellin (archaellin)
MFTRFDRSEYGVSDIIGMILMIAVTIVLVSALGTFAYGFVGDLQQPPQGSVTFKTTTASAADCGGESPCYEVVGIATSMSNADALTVRPTTGAGMSFDEVGDSETEYYEEGVLLTVIAEKAGEDRVIQIYEVGA